MSPDLVKCPWGTQSPLVENWVCFSYLQLNNLQLVVSFLRDSVVFSLSPLPLLWQLPKNLQGVSWIHLRTGPLGHVRLFAERPTSPHCLYILSPHPCHPVLSPYPSHGKGRLSPGQLLIPSGGMLSLRCSYILSRRYFPGLILKSHSNI